MDFLAGLEEAEAATPQSFFRVKEGSGVGKKVANKIADIGIVEEQVPIPLIPRNVIRDKF